MRLTLATAAVALPALVAAAPQPVVHRSGISIPISKRTSFVNADKSVNFDALNAHLAAVQAKVQRGFANYEKNTGSPHPSAVRGVQKRATGAVPLTEDYKQENQVWYGAISVGTPAQKYTVDFDTGSSNMFLPGPNCSSTCNGHTKYDPSASSTSQDLGQTFTLPYGNGSTVSGELFSDTVAVAGLMAINQTLGAATQYSSGFSIDEFPADGVMGMGFESISAYNATPVFQNLVSQGQTTEPVFSFKLASSGSELYLGGANSALYTGGFSYVPVTQQGYWEVNMDSVDNAGKTLMSNIDTIIDTGTTLIVGKPDEVAYLYTQLGGTNASSTAGPGFYTFPCDNFPEVSFTFGGTSFPISADSLNLGPVSSGSPDCISGIVGQDIASSFWIIGDVFLTNVYTTFDVGNTQVGFATLA